MLHALEQRSAVDIIDITVLVLLPSTKRKAKAKEFFKVPPHSTSQIFTRQIEIKVLSVF